MTKVVIPSHENRSEAFYVGQLIETLASTGYRARCEVPNFSQSVDVVATKGRWITAIEVKRFDWRRALKQCVSHEIFADFVCVAIVSKAVPPDLERAAEERGYGLLHYDQGSKEFVWHRRPKQNRNYWSHHRKNWSKTLQGIAYAN